MINVTACKVDETICSRFSEPFFDRFDRFKCRIVDSIVQVSDDSLAAILDVLDTSRSPVYVAAVKLTELHRSFG